MLVDDLDFERQRLDDAEAVALEADELARVVRQQAHGADAEVAEDLRADAVVALVRLEAEPLVRLDGVEPLILQLVRAQLVGEPDAAALLVQIQQHAAPFARDLLHRRVELRAAVAAQSSGRHRP